MTRLSLAALSCLALTACGGGGGAGGNTGTGGNTAGGVIPAQGTYQPLNATVARSSALSGRFVRVASGSRTAQVVQASGTLRHDTGAVELSDGRYTLRDPNGTDAQNRLTDGQGGEAVLTRTVNGHSYDYVTIVEMTYPEGNGVATTLGAGGIPTQAAHMPVAGKATYRGNAAGAQAQSATGAYGIHTARAVVKADFAAARANVALDNFAATSLNTGLATAAPAQSISANGMTISGNGFSGGTVAVNGSTVGAVQSAQVEGQFYGYDHGANIPDEVGGVYYIVGADGVITGTYVAD